MESYSAIIDAWPAEGERSGRQVFADDHAVSLSLVNVWHFRKGIPPTHWHLTVTKAAERGVEGVTLELLSKLATLPRKRPAADGAEPPTQDAA